MAWRLRLAVRALGQALAELLDLADVGLALVGVRGDGEDRGVGGGGVQDEADGLAVGVAAGQGEDPGSVGLGPGLSGLSEALPGALAEPGQHDVGAVDLVAGGAEVLAYRAEVSAAADAVVQEPAGLGVVGVGAGAGVDAQLGLERLADRACFGEADQAVGEVRCLRPGGQPDGQPPGGDMIDAAALAVSGGDAVVDKTFVEGQVWERPVLGQPVGASWLPCLAGQSAASLSGWPLARSC